MKIHSRFRDYYDHVAYQHGGGDPKVIYHRDYIVPDHPVLGGQWNEGHQEIARHLAPRIPEDIDTIRDGKHVRHEFRALIVLGKRYYIERYGIRGPFSTTLVEVWKDWHITKRPILYTPSGNFYAMAQDDEQLLSDVVVSYKQRRSLEIRKEYEREWEKYAVAQGEFSPRLVELSKTLNAPVFIVDRYFHVRGRTPKLGELGFAAYYSAEQLYQELAMFVGNILQPVADPQSPMTDIEKVVSHGFDKKKSFRHRT
jgi:hypothetical protein